MRIQHIPGHNYLADSYKYKNIILVRGGETLAGLLIALKVQKVRQSKYTQKQLCP